MLVGQYWEKIGQLFIPSSGHNGLKCLQEVTVNITLQWKNCFFNTKCEAKKQSVLCLPR